MGGYGWLWVGMGGYGFLLVGYGWLWKRLIHLIFALILAAEPNNFEFCANRVLFEQVKQEQRKTHC